jgi:quercetin dioxygenase-like cupin family protein
MGEGERTGSFNALETEEPFPGVLRQSFNSERATVSRYTFSPRASFPVHRHPQEQVTLIEAGSVDMAVAGHHRRLDAGEWSVVPGNLDHGITAGETGARIVAFVVPRREHADDYELGDGDP